MLFSSFGPPQILHSDQGTKFESNLIKSICDLMDIHKTRTTANHLQADGQIERQNRTLQGILSTFVSEHPDTWDLYIRSQSKYVQSVKRSICSSQSIAQQMKKETKAKQKQSHEQGRGIWIPIETQRNT